MQLDYFIFDNKSFTSASHFRFKNQFDGIIYIFFLVGGVQFSKINGGV